MRRAALAPALVLLASAACHRERPEAQVRAAFERARSALEAGDAGSAAEGLDPAFEGPEGLTRDTARLFLQGLLRRQRVGITVLRDEIRVTGDEALQEVDLVLTGRSGSGLLPDDTSRRTFLLRWRRSHGTWRLREVQSPTES